MIELVIILIAWLYVLLQLLVLAGYLSDRPKALLLKEMPKVAILIAARNEEKSIGGCLASIVKLNYPKDLLEVWVGNDSSEDNTASIVQEFSNQYPFIHLFSVTTNLGSAKAKGNVLAHLVQQSTSPFIFVTDADIEVPTDWIAHLLPHLQNENRGIVSGTTLVDGSTSFAKWQGLEWCLGNGYLIGLDQLGMKSTAVGNNMCFTREAYLATGGYESMPFSVTEDFQLFKAIRQKGYSSLNMLEPNSLTISTAQNNLPSFLHQRKRWMIGAQDLPWYWLFVFGLQALFYPALLALFFMLPKMAILLLLTKMLVQSIYLLLIHKRIRRRINLFEFISFEAYTFFTQLFMIGFYLLPIKMDWKKRRY
ncbi:MAG: glycosyl transferase family 2 [Bacteroidetes bacterium B1(2017)]|nr:MAG: glycosyl transferase family 2 [Bacteroidetes bacterium B1(2017)]